MMALAAAGVTPALPKRAQRVTGRQATSVDSGVFLSSYRGDVAHRDRDRELGFRIRRLYRCRQREAEEREEQDGGEALQGLSLLQ